MRRKGDQRMGKVVVSEFITLDGVIEDPGGSEGTEFGGWSFRFPAEEGQQFKYEELMASDVQLMGRITYEEFAQAWPDMEDSAGEFGAKMNGMPKVVVSTTLSNPAWKNTTVAEGDLPSAVATWSMSTGCWCTRSFSAKASGCSRRAALRWTSRWSRSERPDLTYSF
jgi:dihydrofolate reductase